MALSARALDRMAVRIAGARIPEHEMRRPSPESRLRGYDAWVSMGRSWSMWYALILL